MNTPKWEDDVIKGTGFIKGFLDYMLKERNQLYGTLIHLMVNEEFREYSLPSFSEFSEYGTKYYIEFSGDEENGFKIYLRDREDVP